jgi:hypothetical protein
MLPKGDRIVASRTSAAFSENVALIGYTTPPCPDLKSENFSIPAWRPLGAVAADVVAGFFISIGTRDSNAGRAP